MVTNVVRPDLTKNKNGHKKTKPAPINKRWLEGVIRQAFIDVLTPKMKALGISRLRVVYKPDFAHIAERTLSNMPKKKKRGKNAM